MVSILTLTYQRHHLLEEAIYSYLLQYESYKHHSEMVVINDSPDVKYIFDHPNVKIINLKERFSSIGKKLEWGFTQCKYDWVYRLDDDDLLSPWALELQKNYHTQSPDSDIYRCRYHYFYLNNKYQGLAGSVNNGNSYKKNWVKKINIIDKSIGEDNWLTFNNNANLYTGDTSRYSMIYRWGMGVYHISGMGDKSNEEIYRITDINNKESGVINLNPNFKENYWSQLPH